MQVEQFQEALAEKFPPGKYMGNIDWSVDVAYPIARADGVWLDVDGEKAFVTLQDEVQHEEGNWGTRVCIILRVQTAAEDLFFGVFGHEKSFDYETYWNCRLVEVRPVSKVVTEWKNV